MHRELVLARGGEIARGQDSRRYRGGRGRRRRERGWVGGNCRRGVGRGGSKDGVRRRRRQRLCFYFFFFFLSIVAALALSKVVPESLRHVRAEVGAAALVQRALDRNEPRVEAICVEGGNGSSMMRCAMNGTPVETHVCTDTRGGRSFAQSPRRAPPPRSGKFHLQRPPSGSVHLHRSVPFRRA